MEIRIDIVPQNCPLRPFVKDRCNDCERLEMVVDGATGWVVSCQENRPLEEWEIEDDIIIDRGEAERKGEV